MIDVFEAHAHYLFPLSLKETIEIFKEEIPYNNVKKIIFLSIPHDTENGQVYFDDMQNIKDLFLKKAFSPNGYAFAGLVHPNDYTNEKNVANNFLAQVEEFYKVGYDGIKMLEGYPALLKARKIPLDSVIYDKFYSFCEENSIPITIHIANPVENWDIAKASKYAIALGRVYDASYPTKDEITTQTFNVMKKHPKLRLALAHFGFLSYDACQTEYFMSEYENTLMDITPGGEQLINMSKNWDVWLKFFEKYQDRIIYGSDYYAFPKDENWMIAFNRRPKFIREFFETNTEHLYLDEKFKGVQLDDKIIEKIYYRNAERIYGLPKAIDDGYFVKEIEKIRKNATHYSSFAEEDLNFILESITSKRL